MATPDGSSLQDLFCIWRDNDYYADSARKGFDFFLGLAYTIATLFVQIWSSSSVPLIIALFFVWLALVILAGLGKRKYLIMGLMVLPVIGLLFFGACLFVLGTAFGGNNGSVMVIAAVAVIIGIGFIIGINKMRKG